MTASPTDYMATWEAMLEMRSKIPALDVAWCALGTCAMRDKAVLIAEAASAAFDTENPDVPFDWEFLPAFISKIASFEPLRLSC